ncbi:MAG: hypothetical protein ACNI27_06515 [Desulfovibrio sp.]
MLFKKVVLLLLSVIIIGVGTAEAQSAKKNVIVDKLVLNPDLSSRAIKLVNESVLSGELETAIRKSGRFAIYTRNKGSLDSIRNEQKLNKSSLATGTGPKEGQLQAADLVIIPEIQRISAYREAKPVPNIDGKYFRRDAGTLHMNVQILDAATGEIKASFLVSSNYSTKKQMVNNANRTPSPNVFKQLSVKAARSVVDELIDTVFPMLVISAKGNALIVNRGKDGGLKKGMKLDVFAPGEVLIDPYTNENLGSEETLAATAVVERVDPKKTTLRIVSGGPVERMYIVRKQQ